ncbi:hypothetical protein M0812_26182 [Anaeramoeba flamelloides]|uniref:Uncharacterized protein n=1 Tax=Anaeramoeba flamelloides TaxID=1746091 RepID=A0AAV7Y9X8_9EUKA|nr:hypothetical protein M0812_26182 [Anaeramoeba flamelloides]
MGNEIPTILSKKERKKYSKTTKKHPKAIVLLDSNCCWVDVNRAMLRMLKMKKKSKLYKLTLKDLFPITQSKNRSNSVQYFMAAFRKVTKTKQDLSDFEMDFSTINGLSGCVNCNFSIYPLAKNDICQITVTTINTPNNFRIKENQSIENPETHSDIEKKNRTNKITKLKKLTRNNKMHSSPLLFPSFVRQRSYSENEKSKKMVSLSNFQNQEKIQEPEECQVPKTKKQLEELEELKRSLDLIQDLKIKHSFLDLLNLKTLGTEETNNNANSGTDSKIEQQPNENANENSKKNTKPRSNSVYLPKSHTDNEKDNKISKTLSQETKKKGCINEVPIELELHCCSVNELTKIPLFNCSKQDCEKIVQSLENIQNIHEEAFNTKNGICQKISKELLNERKKNKAKLEKFEKQLFSILEGLQKEKNEKRVLLQENMKTKRNLKTLSLIIKKSLDLAAQNKIQNESFQQFINNLQQISKI